MSEDIILSPRVVPWSELTTDERKGIDFSGAYALRCPADHCGKMVKCWDGTTLWGAHEVYAARDAELRWPCECGEVMDYAGMVLPEAVLDEVEEDEA